MICAVLKEKVAFMPKVNKGEEKLGKIKSECSPYSTDQAPLPALLYTTMKWGSSQAKMFRLLFWKQFLPISLFFSIWFQSSYPQQ